MPSKIETAVPIGGKTPEARLWSRVNKTDACWLWVGRLNSSGYGAIRVFGKWKMVHRLSYELHVGAVPEGLELDHLCRVRRCVRPDHLEPVTHHENVLRGAGPTAINSQKTNCSRCGLPLDGPNLYIVARSGARRCRECLRESWRRSSARYLARKNHG